MARIRSINPSFFEDGDIGLLSPWTIIFFPYLWCQANKYGILKERLAELRPKILPSKISPESCLLELARPKKESPKHPPFILRYEVGGEKYIKILNWKNYQHPHPTEDGKNQRNYPEPPKDTKAPNPSSEEPPTQPGKPDLEPIDMELTVFMADEIRKHNEKFIRPDNEGLEKWAKDIRRMRTIDGREPRDIRAVIEWAQGDDFWQGNIMSPAKLRKQFGQLWSKMHVKKPGDKTPVELEEEDEKALKDPGR